MVPTDPRHQKILELIEEHSSARVPELSLTLGVSEATIRRDLEKLARNGHVQRTHGGAVLARTAESEPPVLHRAVERLAEKQRIGRAAAALIQDGEAVFIGAGTTTMEVARNLRECKNLTVITNALTVTNLLASQEGISLVSTGGLLRSAELCFLGHIAEQTMRQLRPQKVILGARTVSIEDGLTSDYLPEVTTDRAIIESGQEVILVADHTKFGKVSPAFIAPITSISKLVTDEQTPPETIDRLKEMGIDVVVG